MTSLRSSSWPLAAFVLIGLLGCQAETFGADDTPGLATAAIGVTPADAWPGSMVTLRSHGFATVPESLGLLTVGADTAVATRVDDTTFSVHLPDKLYAGDHPFTLKLGADSARGSLSTVGFVSTTVTGVALAVANPQPWPWQAPRGVLGLNPRSEVTYLDASSGRAIRFAGLLGRIGYAPGISYRPNVVTVSDSVGRTMLATLDIRNGGSDAVPVSTPLYRQTFEIDAGQYIVTTNHSTYIGPLGYATESPWYFVISPDGRWGTLVANTSQFFPTNQFQLPMVELADISTAHDLLGIGSTDAAAWGLDSKSVYIAARPNWGGTQLLLRMDPETGDTLASMATESTWWDHGATWALTVDPRRGWLYDLARDEPGWRLRVRDPGTLAIIGSVVIPTTCQAPAFPIIIPDLSSPMIHIIENECSSTMIHHVRLPS